MYFCIKRKLKNIFMHKCIHFSVQNKMQLHLHFSNIFRTYFFNGKAVFSSSDSSKNAFPFRGYVGKCRGWGWNPAAKKRKGEFLFFFSSLGHCTLRILKPVRWFFLLFSCSVARNAGNPGEGEKPTLVVWDILFATKWCEALRSWKGRGRVVLSCILLFSIQVFLLQKCDATLRKRNWNRFSVKRKFLYMEGTFHFFEKNLAFPSFPSSYLRECLRCRKWNSFSSLPMPQKERREEDAIHVELMPFFLSSCGSHTCNIFPLSCCPHTHISPFPLLFRV